MFVKMFNDGVGTISDLTGASLEPAKGIRSYNIKAGLFNMTTLSLIYGIGLTIFSNPLAGLTVCGFSLASKLFIHNATKKTFFGVTINVDNDFFIKKFVM